MEPLINSSHRRKQVHSASIFLNSGSGLWLSLMAVAAGLSEFFKRLKVKQCSRPVALHRNGLKLRHSQAGKQTEEDDCNIGYQLHSVLSFLIASFAQLRAPKSWIPDLFIITTHIPIMLRGFSLPFAILWSTGNLNKKRGEALRHHPFCLVKRDLNHVSLSALRCHEQIR